MFASTSGCRIPRRRGDKPTSLNSTKLKQKQEICSTRDPFHDLGNGGGGGSIVNLSSSSSVSSIEAPRGCLRFFLNPSSKPSNRKNSNHQHRRPVKLKSVSSGKTPSSRVSEKTVGVQGKSGRVSSLKSVGVGVSKLKSGSGGCNGGRADSNSNSNSTPLRTAGDDSNSNSNSNSNSTPLTDVKDGSSLKSNSNTKTPPLHSTVSPEIQQCQSSVISTAKKSVTTTPVCYGAGHLLSGVTDKRKCRPRGLLVVGEDIVVDKFDIDDVSPSTLPVKASMHWLNSPGTKEEARNRRVVNDSPPALPCNGGASSDMSEENTRRMAACSSEFGGFQAANASSDMDISPPPQEKLVVRSPLSMEMNVVQTPESESSSRVRNIVTRWSNENGTKGWGSELDSVDRHLQKLSTSSPSSFRSDPGDLLQFQKAMDIRDDAQLSTSTLDDVSGSEVGISWRDGLVSRIFELDELDCCRCLSDEEVEIDSNNVDLREKIELRNDPDEELGLDGNGEDDVSCLPAAAESMAISSDGGALFQSDDSDWTQCYKNQLFKI
ncbi:hypothetical protein LINPERHAP1_LOCUS43883 [Linum perenne]